MSYILDALKKSELQRQQQLNTASGAESEAPVALAGQAESSSVITVIALLLVVLVLLAVLLYRLWPWQGAEPDAAVTAVVMSASDESSAGRDQVQQRVPADTSPKEHVAEFVPEPVRVVEAAVPIKPAAAPAIAAADIEAPVDAVTRHSAEPARRPDNSRTLPPLEALRRVPPLMITSHIYSPVAAKRTVSMNNREWNEGDLVAPGVVLAEITPDGIVLEVDGWPLHIGRSKGWQAIP
ncbi:MAG: general secretion pathway protein GspB [Saccharospirillaceae bacterium]|nr:general secretion pathway protein GspB [Saccharospirillaceae bacterium]MCD8531687.1 general secretion pathway protein GspB [Saccharospirillaceae bacterium]